MSSYNKFERYLSRLLSRFPLAKSSIKKIYSRLVYIKYKKNVSYSSIFPISAVQESSTNSFFGYYDKSPQNSDGLLIMHSCAYSTSDVPSTENIVDIVVVGEDGETLLETSSRTFNWQQGTRAQWLSEDLFIFNDLDNSCDAPHYCSKVYSVKEKKEIKRFSFPVQDAFSTDFFLSLNYKRLMSLRPDYGYRNLEKLDEESLRNLKDDGIWKIDFETGAAVLLISIEDICRVSWKMEFSLALHKVNHIMLSPKGDKFIFLHRYFVGGQRFDRLFYGDSATGKISLLSDYGMVSHCCWMGNRKILGYMRGPNQNDGYWILDVVTNAFESFLGGRLDGFGDGHPHICGRFVVTDTYPDKARMQHLIVADIDTGEIKEVGSFFHGFSFSGESRCDLHPRFSLDGRHIFFDSVFTGERELYKMEFEG